MCWKCIGKNVRIGWPNLKETYCNGVNKVHKNWDNFDVTNNDISMKTTTKNDKCVSVCVIKRIKNEYKAQHHILGLWPCYKTRYKRWWPIVVHGKLQPDDETLT